MMRLSLVLLYCIAVSIRCALAQEQDCVYLYTEQPPSSLGCNPYEQRELRMECTVHGPGDQDFELAWFRLHSDALQSPFVGDDSALLVEDDNDVSIQSQVREHGNGTKKTIRSQLRVRLDRDPSAGDVAFWCSVVTHAAAADGGNPVTLPSDAFVLRIPEAYINLPNCGVVPQSSHKNKCGLFSINKPSPTTSATPETSPLHISATSQSTTTSWQTPPPSSQHPRPTNSVLPGHAAPDNNITEEDSRLNTIVYPLLACITGVVGTLFIISCIYLLCYYKQKKSKAVKKQIVEATYHTYSLPNTLSTQHSKGAHHIGLETSSSSSSPTLPPPRRTRSVKFDNSSGCSHDQYIDMSSGVITSEDNYFSCPTLNRTGHLPSFTSDYGSFKQGLSYEVPVPFQHEPDYDTISSTYVPYLIPIPSLKSPLTNILQHGIHRHHSLCSYNGMYIPPHNDDTLPPSQTGNDHHDVTVNSAPTSPTTGHDYEELIHTRANTAYREMTVQDNDHQNKKKVDTPQRTIINN